MNSDFFSIHALGKRSDYTCRWFAMSSNMPNSPMPFWMMLEIGKYLEFHDLISCSYVCTSWNKYFKSMHMWCVHYKQYITRIPWIDYKLLRCIQSNEEIMKSALPEANRFVKNVKRMHRYINSFPRITFARDGCYMCTTLFLNLTNSKALGENMHRVQRTCHAVMRKARSHDEIKSIWCLDINSSSTTQPTGNIQSEQIIDCNKTDIPDLDFFLNEPGNKFLKHIHYLIVFVDCDLSHDTVHHSHLKRVIHIIDKLITSLSNRHIVFIVDLSKVSRTALETSQLLGLTSRRAGAHHVGKRQVGLAKWRLFRLSLEDEDEMSENEFEELVRFGRFNLSCSCLFHGYAFIRRI